MTSLVGVRGVSLEGGCSEVAGEPLVSPIRDFISTFTHGGSTSLLRERGPQLCGLSPPTLQPFGSPMLKTFCKTPSGIYLHASGWPPSAPQVQEPTGFCCAGKTRGGSKETESLRMREFGGSHSCSNWAPLFNHSSGVTLLGASELACLCLNRQESLTPLPRVP